MDLKVEGCYATADFAATTCCVYLRGSRRRRSRQHIPFGEREEDESVTQVASMTRDTSADNEAGGHGETLAPNPCVLNNAEGPLDRDELVAIDSVVARNELSGE